MDSQQRSPMKSALVAAMLLAGGSHAAASNCKTYTSFAANGPNPSEILSTIKVTDAMPLASATVRDLTIEHGRVGSIKISLTAEAEGKPAKTATLKDIRQGGSAAGLTQTQFADSAETTFPLNEVGAPFTAAFKPVEPLSTLLADGSAGAWTLRVVDLARDPQGRKIQLQKWNLELCSGEPVAVVATPVETPAAAAVATPVETPAAAAVATPVETPAGPVDALATGAEAPTADASTNSTSNSTTAGNGPLGLGLINNIAPGSVLGSILGQNDTNVTSFSGASEGQTRMGNLKNMGSLAMDLAKKQLEDRIETRRAGASAAANIGKGFASNLASTGHDLWRAQNNATKDTVNDIVAAYTKAVTDTNGLIKQALEKRAEEMRSSVDTAKTAGTAVSGMLRSSADGAQTALNKQLTNVLSGLTALAERGVGLTHDVSDVLVSAMNATRTQVDAKMDVAQTAEELLRSSTNAATKTKIDAVNTLLGQLITSLEGLKHKSGPVASRTIDLTGAGLTSLRNSLSSLKTTVTNLPTVTGTLDHLREQSKTRMANSRLGKAAHNFRSNGILQADHGLLELVANINRLDTVMSSLGLNNLGQNLSKHLGGR